MMTWFGNQPETVVAKTECLPTYRATWRPPAPGGGPSSFWSGRSLLACPWDVPVLEMGSVWFHRGPPRVGVLTPPGWVLCVCELVLSVNVLVRGGVMVCMVLLLLAKDVPVGEMSLSSIVAAVWEAGSATSYVCTSSLLSAPPSCSSEPPIDQCPSLRC